MCSTLFGTFLSAVPARPRREILLCDALFGGDENKHTEMNFSFSVHGASRGRLRKKQWTLLKLGTGKWKKGTKPPIPLSILCLFVCVNFPVSRRPSASSFLILRSPFINRYSLRFTETRFEPWGLKTIPYNPITAIYLFQNPTPERDRLSG